MALEEDVILHFDIDEQPAVNSIKDLRAANKQLREERDKVNISTKTGQDAVQKLNAQIDKNNKLIKDNSSALEKQRQNVGNYSKSIQEAAGELNIMGTNVGALGTKLASFVNPATAAVGIVTALGSAYASSTIGAKDLGFATAQLSNATMLLSNSFASMISSAEDGEGFFSRLADSFIFKLSPALAIQSKALAFQAEKMEDLGRDEIRVRKQVFDRLSENQEIMVALQDSQVSYNEKIHLSGQAIENITKNEDALLAVKNEQLNIAKTILASDRENEEKQDLVLSIEEEISRIQKEANQNRAKIQKLESNITDQHRKQLELIQKQNAERQKGLDSIKKFTPGGDTGDITFNDDAATTTNPIFDSVVEFRSAEEIKRDEARTTALQINAYNELVAKNEQELNELRLESAQVYFAGVATLAAAFQGEQSALFKIAATAEAIIATYQGANKALGSAPPPLSFALAAATVATGLANVARINGVGFAEGGYTGRGAKYQPAGIVHKGEYVAPQNVVNSPSAQPHLAALESMRTKGFADGGFVANQNQQQVRQAMMFANALKNMPPVIASWTEGRAVGRKLEFKEKVARQ